MRHYFLSTVYTCACVCWPVWLSRLHHLAGILFSRNWGLGGEEAPILFRLLSVLLSSHPARRSVVAEFVDHVHLATSSQGINKSIHTTQKQRFREVCEAGTTARILKTKILRILVSKLYFLLFRLSEAFAIKTLLRHHSIIMAPSIILH